MSIKPYYSGKVRDVYEVGENLLVCASDRISAFDVIFKEKIPGKGIILNAISNLWFRKFLNVPNHFITDIQSEFPEPFNTIPEFSERSVLVKKCRRIDFECVVRGYIAGSGWKEYTSYGTLAGKKLPRGLRESQKLSEPAFTPAVKNDTGHDENISEEEMHNTLGHESFEWIKNTSLYLYNEATKILSKQGIILCDTKFEFGYFGDSIILIDEVLTPDSSRFWEESQYEVGISPPSMDKQILRNYLETTGWDKNPPPPELSEKIIQDILDKYKEIYRRIQQCI